MPEPRRHTLPFGLAGLLIALVAVALVVALLPRSVSAPATASTRARPTFQTTRLPLPASSTSPTPGQPTDPTTRASARPTPADADEATLAALVAGYDGTAKVGVAAVNLTTRRQVIVGPEQTAQSASIAKLDIVAALLLQRQGSKDWLSDDEQDDVKLAMQQSNNEAADRLLAAVGGGDALAKANRRLGLTETTMRDDDWIETSTTLNDQITLLDAVTTADSPLDERSRSYLYAVMRGVDDGQNWGVGRVGLDPRVKNGWMHLSDDWNQWALNSIGITRSADGQLVLIAILSEGWLDIDAGIAAMDELAKAALAAVA